MYVLNSTDDYDKITCTICTDNENNIDKVEPTLLLTKPCGISLICLRHLMIYTMIKLLFKTK